MSGLIRSFSFAIISGASSAIACLMYATPLSPLPYLPLVAPGILFGIVLALSAPRGQGRLGRRLTAAVVTLLIWMIALLAGFVTFILLPTQSTLIPTLVWLVCLVIGAVAAWLLVTAAKWFYAVSLTRLRLSIGLLCGAVSGLAIGVAMQFFGVDLLGKTLLVLGFVIWQAAMIYVITARVDSGSPPASSVA